MIPAAYETDPPRVGDLCWCIHHDPRDGKAPLEILTEPIENRADYIRHNKPAHEIETRLHAMRKAKGPFPKSVMQAYAAWKQAAWEQGPGHAAWEQAQAAWEKALDKNESELMRLFRVECRDVAWEEGGLVFRAKSRTIQFSGAHPVYDLWQAIRQFGETEKTA